jgi:hypothetical protein
VRKKAISPALTVSDNDLPYPSNMENEMRNVAFWDWQYMGLLKILREMHPADKDVFDLFCKFHPVDFDLQHSFCVEAGGSEASDFAKQDLAGKKGLLETAGGPLIPSRSPVPTIRLSTNWRDGSRLTIGKSVSSSSFSFSIAMRRFAISFRNSPSSSPLTCWIAIRALRGIPSSRR